MTQTAFPLRGEFVNQGLSSLGEARFSPFPLAQLYLLAKDFEFPENSLSLSETSPASSLEIEFTGPAKYHKDILDFSRRVSLSSGLSASVKIFQSGSTTPEGIVLISCPTVSLSLPQSFVNAGTPGRIVTQETDALTALLLRSQLPPLTRSSLEETLISHGLKKRYTIEWGDHGIAAIAIDDTAHFLEHASTIELLKALDILQNQHSTMLIVRLEPSRETILHSLRAELKRVQPSSIEIDETNKEISLHVGPALSSDFAPKIRRETGYEVTAVGDTASLHAAKSRAFIDVFPDTCTLSEPTDFEVAHIQSILSQYFGACTISVEGLFVTASVPRQRAPSLLVNELRRELRYLQVPLLIHNGPELASPLTQADFKFLAERSLPEGVLLRSTSHREGEIELTVSATRDRFADLATWRAQLEGCLAFAGYYAAASPQKAPAVSIVLVPFESKVTDALLSLSAALRTQLAERVDSRGRIIARRMLTNQQREQFDLSSLSQCVHNIWKEISDPAYQLERYMKFSPQAKLRHNGGLEDWSSHAMISVDGPAARLFEDGFGCTKLPEAQGWRVETHLSRVAPFIPLGSDLDRIARNNFKSLYGKNASIPMLPKAFLMRYVSFIPGRERYAWTFCYTISPEGKISDVSVHQTMVKNDAQYTWGDADKVILSNSRSNNTEQLLCDLHDASRAAQKTISLVQEDIAGGPTRAAIDTQLSIVSRLMRERFKKSGVNFFSGRIGGAARDYRRLINQHALEGLFGYQRPLSHGFISEVRDLEKQHQAYLAARAQHGDTIMELRNALSTLPKDGILWGVLDFDEAGHAILLAHARQGKEGAIPPDFIWIHDDALLHERDAVVTPEGQRVQRGAPIATKVCGFNLIDGRLIAELLLDYS